MAVRVVFAGRAIVHNRAVPHRAAGHVDASRRPADIAVDEAVLGNAGRNREARAGVPVDVAGRGPVVPVEDAALQPRAICLEANDAEAAERVEAVLGVNLK